MKLITPIIPSMINPEPKTIVKNSANGFTNKVDVAKMKTPIIKQIIIIFPYLSNFIFVLLATLQVLQTRLR